MEKQEGLWEHSDSFLEGKNLFFVNKQFFLKWRKLRTGKQLRTQWSSCESALLRTQQAAQSCHQGSVPSTRGRTDAHDGSCSQQRSQLTSQFPAHCPGSGARIHPCEADVNPCEGPFFFPPNPGLGVWCGVVVFFFEMIT